MTITAKYQSRCPCCGELILPGTHVEWVRGQKAKHPGCARKAASQGQQWDGRATERQIAYAWSLLDQGRKHSDGWDPTYAELQKLTRKEISDLINDLR